MVEYGRRETGANGAGAAETPAAVTSSLPAAVAADPPGAAAGRFRSASGPDGTRSPWRDRHTAEPCDFCREAESRLERSATLARERHSSRPAAPGRHRYTVPANLPPLEAERRRQGAEMDSLHPGGRPAPICVTAAAAAAWRRNPAENPAPWRPFTEVPGGDGPQKRNRPGAIHADTLPRNRFQAGETQTERRQTMTRENAKNYLKQHANIGEMLERGRKSGRVCPFCGSGQGANGTGALKVYDDNTAHCFSCGRSVDAIDLYAYRKGIWDGQGKINGIDFNRALESMARAYGIEIDPLSSRDGTQPPRQAAPSPAGTPQTAPTGTQAPGRQEKKPPPDFTAYLAECSRRLDGPDGEPGRAYFRARGISLETARAAGCGFDPAADPAGKGYFCPRVIIPTGIHGYVARSIDPSTPKKYQKMNPLDGSMEIFNVSTLWDPENTKNTAVFVTEGVFDALSYLEAGEKAVALNGATNAVKLVKLLEKQPSAATLIVALDSDATGSKWAEQLRQDLNRLNISHTEYRLPKGPKDANEFLTADGEGFLSAARQAVTRAGSRPDGIADYIENLMVYEMQAFQDPIKTGFQNLDRKAFGLYSGLYCLAALSSLGKTTFCMQMADQIAATGQDVLFFSLEQSRLELASKSLARQIAVKRGDDARDLDDDTAGRLITSLRIRRGKGLTPEETREVLEASGEYTAAVGNRLSVVEGNFGNDIGYIENYVLQYCRRNGTHPVVFIDYLQVLDPGLDALGRPRPVREAVDDCVKRLKALSRQLGLTVIMISSVNRSSYLLPIDFESLKESGLIEFTCDVVYGMQLTCMKDDLFTKPNALAKKREALQEAKSARPRKVELVCLKNRYGGVSWRVAFDYFPEIDLFRETAPDGDDGPNWKRYATKGTRGKGAAK